jgi:hypothetical protein
MDGTGGFEPELARASRNQEELSCSCWRALRIVCHAELTAGALHAGNMRAHTAASPAIVANSARKRSETNTQRFNSFLVTTVYARHACGRVAKKLDIVVTAGDRVRHGAGKADVLPDRFPFCVLISPSAGVIVCGGL